MDGCPRGPHAGPRRNIGPSRPGMRFGPPLTDISDEIMLAGAQSRRSGQETTEILAKAVLEGCCPLGGEPVRWSSARPLD